MNLQQLKRENKRLRKDLEYAYALASCAMTELMHRNNIAMAPSIIEELNATDKYLTFITDVNNLLSR